MKIQAVLTALFTRGFCCLRSMRRLTSMFLFGLAATSALIGQTINPLTVANESVNSYNCDVYRWIDSAGKQRTAALSSNNAADPGGSTGGVLYQYRFTPAGTTTERVITGTGAHSYNGYGYVVNHYDETAYVSTRTIGTYTKILTGRHHAIHQFKLTYPLNSVNVTATIHWYFATGLDNPVYAITYDTSAAGSGGLSFEADSRAPYGDMQFGGDGSDPYVSGVAWGDKYKFFTRDEPVTPQSSWDYTQTNTVPYTQMWINSPDAEMGAVQTQTWLQHNTGGSWFSSNWGQTSENRVVGDGTTFGAWMMPTNWQWPYQLNQYEMMDNTSPTKSKRCAWGLMFGAVGKTSYYGYGSDYKSTLSGHPYQSYSVATVIGIHSTSAVQTQVTRTERLLSATITANTGTLVTAGPGGAGRTDTVSYSKAGYNAVYSAYELTADNTGSFNVSLNTTGAVKNPTFIVHSIGGVPTSLNLDGTALTADVDYFASYDNISETLWLTVNRAWSGSHVLATGVGLPPAVTVSVSPSAIALQPSDSTTFTATVTNSTNQNVTWSVVEAGGGTITSGGVYTAPATSGSYHVRATSVADPTKTAEATATVAVTPPSIISFSASPTSINSGQSSTLNWSVSGTTSLSINQGVGAVTGTSKSVSPTATTTYTLTATGPGGTATATATVAVGTSAITYTYIYQSGLKGGWSDTSWGATVNLAAGSLGHSGSAAIEASAPGAWQGISLADVANWQRTTYHYLSEVHTIEFDIYPHSDSVGFESMVFDLDDGDDNTEVDTPTLVSLIPGWSSMTAAQRYDRWHHVVVDLSTLNAKGNRFFRITFFKYADSGNPHFRLADIKYGTVADVLPPTITLGTTTVDYDQLTLSFTTNEAAIYRIEYGYGNYANTLTSPTTPYTTTHSPVLTGLTRGSTLQYRIVAIDPSGNQGTLTGSATITDSPPSLHRHGHHHGQPCRHPNHLTLDLRSQLVPKLFHDLPQHYPQPPGR